jgi:hypothetical protein
MPIILILFSYEFKFLSFSLKAKEELFDNEIKLGRKKNLNLKIKLKSNFLKKLSSYFFLSIK